MASRSERLAELRAALLELDACVAKYRGVRVPRAPSAGAPPGAAAQAHARGVRGGGPGRGAHVGGGPEGGRGAAAGTEADVGAHVGADAGARAWRRIAKRLLRPPAVALLGGWRRWSLARKQPAASRAPPA